MDTVQFYPKHQLIVGIVSLVALCGLYVLLVCGNPALGSFNLPRETASYRIFQPVMLACVHKIVSSAGPRVNDAGRNPHNAPQLVFAHYLRRGTVLFP